MARPWICSSCRTRLPSIVLAPTGTRRISSGVGVGVGGGVGAVQERAPIPPLTPPPRRGRYSGKLETLRPETILQKLDEDGRKTSPYHRRLANLPLSLIRDTEDFIAAADDVRNKDVRAAWKILEEKILPELRRMEVPRRRNWMRIPLVQPRLNDFRGECTRLWLRSLNDEENHAQSVPSPYDFVHRLEQLGFGKAVFYRPTLWDVAAGVNDLRFEHPDVDLQPGVHELMKLWRLCHLATIARAKQIDPEMTERSADWSFLPPATVFATSAAPHTLDELLETIVVLSKDAVGDPAKRDYTSPALLTLDVLRTTPCGHVDGRMSVCADRDEYRPWVRLMETLLRVAAPKSVPVCLGRKLMVESGGVREKYARLLRRVGVKQDAVDNAMTVPSATHGREGEKAKQPLTFQSTEQGRQGEALQQSTTSNQQEEALQQSTISDRQEEALPGKRDHLRHVPEEEKTFPHIKFANPPSDPHIEQKASRYVSGLGRALETSDIHRAEKLRRDIAACPSTEALPVEVYEHLMMVLFALKAPRSAMEVWQKFLHDGYTPTVKTYTVLMQGASHAHDVTSLEKFWHAMRHHAALQPDSHAWSTRVNGLFSARLPQKGLAALSDMGKEWYTAARDAEWKSAGTSSSDRKQSKKLSSPEPTLQLLLAKYPSSIGEIPRPGLVVMNSAIASLASSHHDAEIPKVLQWGRTFGIEPDLITYNALLNICMRFSRAEEALSLLTKMRTKGIEADSTTWTVLLTALFQSGFLDDIPRESQAQKVLDFIKSVETTDPSSSRILSGLDVKGYALILDRLLKHHANPHAAAQVLQYMTSVANLQPTAQIYTILMTSYFYPPGGDAPPDFHAIEMLWRQISTPDPRTGHRVALDPIFFDRMIEGYARFHSLLGTSKPAMEFLAKSGERGMKPGYEALEAVGRMLVERGEWGVWRRLVEEVGKRPRGKAVYQRQRSFWEFVRDCGVLGEEGVEAFLKRVGREREHWGGGEFSRSPRVGR